MAERHKATWGNGLSALTNPFMGALERLLVIKSLKQPPLVSPLKGAACSLFLLLLPQLWSNFTVVQAVTLERVEYALNQV